MLASGLAFFPTLLLLILLAHFGVEVQTAAYTTRASTEALLARVVRAEANERPYTRGCRDLPDLTALRGRSDGASILAV